jgi:hypothetical protein
MTVPFTPATRRCAALAAALSLAAPAAQAEQRVPVLDDKATWSFTLENDLFAGTDKGYTNGFLFSWRSSSYNPPGWLAWIGSHSRFLLPRDGALRWGLSFGQNIYTPSETGLRTPDPTDRPYAGWLYGSFVIAAYADRSPRLTEYGAFEIQLGVVGPSALGEQVQNNVHDFINVDRAFGWDRQLKDEPGVNVILTRKWRMNQPIDGENPWGLAVGVVPSVTVSLGNVQTYASAGLLMRVGSNLYADFGPSRIRPAPAGSGFFQPDGKWGWYLFAGFEGRGVAHDIFLDGNTWRDGPSVDKRPFVGEGVFGAALVMPWARLTYSHSFRSREFWGQDETPEFGSVTLSVRF